MTTNSPRSAFEQQLCSQLLSLSGVAETLADRVMALEARLAEVEGQQVADAAHVAISDDAGELLSASEEKVRLLRDRLAPVNPAPHQGEVMADVVPLATVDQDISPQDSVGEDALPEDESSEDTEYVDDPQIDLMTA